MLQSAVRKHAAFYHFLQTSSLPPLHFLSFLDSDAEQGNKRAHVDPVLIHGRQSAANKQGWGGEMPTLLFAVDYILYGIISKWTSFVVQQRANCRAWRCYCTVPRQGDLEGNKREKDEIH